MKRLIAILISATITLTGCSSTSSKEGGKDTNNKNAVVEEITYCLYCNKDSQEHELFHYPTYNDIKKGSYHEDCYRKLLDEKFTDDHSEGYEMIVCTNCSEYGEAIKDWVAYGHYETECTSCGSKLEVKKFATYEDFLVRNGEVKEEVASAEPVVEQPNYEKCGVCGKSNSTVSYRYGIHAFYSAGNYCDNCYNHIYAEYEREIAEWEQQRNTCIICYTNTSEPVEFYDGGGYITADYYHYSCYSSILNDANQDPGTVYCPSCGYETGEYGQQYLYNHGDTSCPQCGYTMVEH